MEYNVKNCLGSGSAPTIQDEFTLQTAWYDDHVYVVSDSMFGYTPPNSQGDFHIYADGASEEEAEWVQRRIDQLEALMNLTKPVTLEDCYGGMTCDWSNDEIRRFEEWNAQDSDPCETHYGRNE